MKIISVPCEQTITAKGCAELFFHSVFPHWGIPLQIVSDRDPRWTSDLWRSMFEGLGTTLLLSTSFHPQTNGRIERMHRDLNAMMRQIVNETHTNWPDQLPFVVHGINSTKSSSTGYSPYELARVVAPKNVPGWARPPDGTAAGELIDRAMQRRSRARDNILKARGNQAVIANRKRKPDADPQKAIGEFFLVRTANFACAPDRSRKWTAPWAGPFECVDFIPATSTYTLELTPRYPQRRIHPRFHGSQVKKWIATDEDRFPNRLFNPKPLSPIDSVTMTSQRSIKRLADPRIAEYFHENPTILDLGRRILGPLSPSRVKTQSFEPILKPEYSPQYLFKDNEYDESIGPVLAILL
ncbi:BQ5605_C007g04863 [Microbotryum silenes-dioicae]|uniref:BQ5605_C007g04863 protein n=1 Tax=Microbotryum silenes-dioicae TaxID=796604 RepID=A0A2X0PA92_9BASI|nr:BQ5605_C007g04863 [Microbotryum silenes-dioicae]